VNGWYLLAQEVWVRAVMSLRGWILGRKLRTRGFRVGQKSIIKGLCCMQIGRDFHAGAGLWLEAVTHYNQQSFTPRIVIGDRVHMSRGVHIAATNYVVIGDDCLFGSNVTVIDHNHGQYSDPYSSPYDPPSRRPLDHNRVVTIGRNVWLADGVVVTPGSSIGEGSVVGANTTIRGDIPPFSIVTGNPFVIRKQYDVSRREWVTTR